MRTVGQIADDERGAGGGAMPGSSDSSRRSSCSSPAFSCAGVPSATTRPASRIARRSTARSASTTLWVTSRTALPSSARARTADHSRRRRTGSTSLVGSSRTTTRPGHHGGHGEGDEALDAAGEALAIRVQPFPDVQRIDEALTAGAHVGRAAAAELTHEVDGLARGQPVDGQLRLGLQRAGLAGVAWVRDRVTAVDADAARVGTQETDDLVDERRLAGTVVAEQAVDLAPLRVEGDAVVGAHAGTTPEGPSIRLGDLLDFEQHGGSPGCASGVGPGAIRLRYSAVSIFWLGCQYLVSILIPRGIL